MATPILRPRPLPASADSRCANPTMIWSDAAAPSSENSQASARRPARSSNGIGLLLEGGLERFEPEATHCFDEGLAIGSASEIDAHDALDRVRDILRREAGAEPF